MFFATYLLRELRRRLPQATFIALGLALAVGLVIAVSATLTGVSKAESRVLGTLYGIGTDVTVTGATPAPPSPGGQRPPGSPTFEIGPNGAEMCSNGTCKSVAGQTIENVNAPYTPFAASKVDGVAGLRDVRSAVGGLTLNDEEITFSATPGSPPQSNATSVDGVDTTHTSIGPLGSATVTAGRDFTARDADAADAVVDSGYAKSHGLHAGSTVTVDHSAYTVIGIVSQPQSTNPTEIYIPLERAQGITTAAGVSLAGQVNTVYVAATSSADISTVHDEISKLLPGTTVTTESSLANTVTGSISNASTLANELGKWLSVLVLIAAFVVASLLTMAAVTRRAAEFGTLKAIGWRSWRVIAQVVGESVVIGLAGAAAGIALGFVGVAIITRVAPNLSATIPGSSNGGPQRVGAGGGRVVGPGASLSQASHTVTVPFTPTVTVEVILVAVLLAVLGGLLAGAFASWRIARLRPAAALARVA